MVRYGELEDGQGFSCRVCGKHSSPTVDCQYCDGEIGLCDDCILGFTVTCPRCGQWQ